MTGTTSRKNTFLLSSSLASPLGMLMVLLFCIQSCSIAQKKSKNQDSPTKYNGSIIQDNQIKSPSYKILLSGEEINRNLSFLQLERNDFDKKPSEFLLGLINDSLATNKNGSSITIDFVKINGSNRELKSFQIQEYYKIKFEASRIVIAAYDLKGLVNALASLDYELQDGSLGIQEIIDWPSIEFRVKQVYLKSMDPEVLKLVLHRLWRGHYNAALYTMHNSVKFEAIKAYCLPDAMSVDDFKSVVDYGRKFNLEPIPQFNFLSHQERNFISKDVSPELLFNDQTLDPRKPKVYDIIFSTIDQTIELINPKYFHIGHDEVVGHVPKHIAKYGPILPPELYLANVKKINSYINQKKISTMLWGDMLLYADDFKDMHPGAMNATQSYRWLIDSIPKNIIICDWHYRDYQHKLRGKLSFSTIDYFLDKGFQVLGATFNSNELTRQFSNYVEEKNHPQFRGMIATSWHKLLKGTTYRKETNDQMKEFDAILEYSANAYWNAK